MTADTRDEILDELWAIARLDDVVTRDEAELLRTLEQALARYTALDREAQADEVVDFREFMALRRARRDVLERTLQTALEDGRVTDDERRLLVRLIEVLPRVR